MEHLNDSVALLSLSVIGSEELSSTDKIVCATITGEQVKSGGACTLTNSELSAIIRKSPSTIGNALCKLKELGFISVRFEYLSGGKGLKKRMLSQIEHAQQEEI